MNSTGIHISKVHGYMSYMLTDAFRTQNGSCTDFCHIIINLHHCDKLVYSLHMNWTFELFLSFFDFCFTSTAKS